MNLIDIVDSVVTIISLFSQAAKGPALNVFENNATSQSTWITEYTFNWELFEESHFFPVKFLQY